MKAMEDLTKQMLDLNKRREMMTRHNAGATMRPIHPFKDLQIIRNKEELSKEFVQTRVVPCNMEIMADIRTVQARLLEIKGEIERQTVERLLGDFNWRTPATQSRLAIGQRRVDELLGLCFHGLSGGRRSSRVWRPVSLGPPFF